MPADIYARYKNGEMRIAELIIRKRLWAFGSFRIERNRIRLAMNVTEEKFLRFAFVTTGSRDDEIASIADSGIDLAPIQYETSVIRTIRIHKKWRDGIIGRNFLPHRKPFKFIK